MNSSVRVCACVDVGVWAEGSGGGGGGREGWGDGGRESSKLFKALFNKTFPFRNKFVCPYTDIDLFPHASVTSRRRPECG